MVFGIELMSGVIFFFPSFPSLEASLGGPTGAYSMEKSTLESLFEFISTMSEVDLLSIYQYALTITALAQVSHPTSIRSTGNKIQDQMQKQLEGVTMSVPLKVVQQVVDIIPIRVLSVFVDDSVRFFGLEALSRVNYARMGGSGDFLANVSKTYYDRTPIKAPKITLTECWLTPDDVMEPLRLLVSVVLLSNVTFGLCLLGLSGVVARRFSELRLTNVYDEDNKALLALHVRQLYHYVELIRRRHEWETLSVDQVPCYFSLQRDIMAEAVRLERLGVSDSVKSSGETDQDKSKERDSVRPDKVPVKHGFCDHFNGTHGCRFKDNECKFFHKCSECKSKNHGRSACKMEKKKEPT